MMRIRPASLAAGLKSLLGVGRTVVSTPHGRFWIDPLSHLGFELSERGHYEDAMRRTLEKYLRPGSTFVDVGANEGYFTVIAARRCGIGGRVVAIEPQERLLPVITQNLRLNGFEWATIANVAVSDSPGVVELHLAPNINTGGSGLHRQYRYRVPTQQTAAQTLAQILDEQNLERVDLMKMDIEGFEYEALLGSPSVFAQHRVRTLALELHPRILEQRQQNAADITGMLTQHGYRMVDTSVHMSTPNQCFLVWVAGT
jgi:FkbM family methyltransferase